MSRRVATTLSIQVRLRVPPGSNTAAVLQFVRDGLKKHAEAQPATIRTEYLDHGGLQKVETDPNPLASLDTDSMIVKLEKKETVYL